MTQSCTRAVILAGGQGTRLLPLTAAIPKSLVEVAGEPFVHHQLRLLARNGIHDVVLCVGYLGDQIEANVGTGNRFGLFVTYVHDGEEPLGTAGAIKKALGVFGDEPFFVLYGDSYLTCDYQEVFAAFRASGKPGLMSVFRNDSRWGTSNVEFDGGRICAYDKLNLTPSMKHIDYGLSVFRPEVFRQLPAETFINLTLVYNQLLREGQLAAFEVPERFYEIGSHGSLKETENHILTIREKENVLR